MLISPSRNFLLISEFVRPTKFRENVLSTLDFKSEKLFGETDKHTSGINNDGEMLRLSSHVKEPSPGVPSCIQYPKDDFKKVCGKFDAMIEGSDAQICSSEGSCAPLNTQLSGATFVNDGLVLVDTSERPSQQSTRANWGLALLQRTGKVLYQNSDKDRKGPRPGFVSTAMSLPRFSFSTAHITFGKDGLDWFQSVHVFDITQMRVTLDLQFEGHGSSQFRPLDAAISPDGTSLVVLSRNALELYRVP
jgi:hypothetical protein